MSTIKAINIQHPSAANAAITLDANSGLTFTGNIVLSNTTISNTITFSNTVIITGNTTLANVSVSGNLSIARVNTAANNSFGTSGQVLTSNGSGNAYWSTISASGSLVSYSVYTSTQTITIPTGATAAMVELIAAGGGGYNGGYDNRGGYAGSSGGGLKKYLTGLTSGSTLSLTVGSGGSAGSPGSAGSSNTTLASGTQTITRLSASPGGGGGGVGVQGSPGAASNGDINVTGSVGTTTILLSTTCGTSYYSSEGGALGPFGYSGFNKNSKAGYGGGGYTDAGGSGGTGGDGVCIITWYR